MTDREMLLISYGAMRAVVKDERRLEVVVELLEGHLYPPKVENVLEGSPQHSALQKAADQVAP